MLQTVKDWIAQFAWWEGQTTVDYVDSAAPGAGLFPKGYREIQRTMDILGNVTVKYRFDFTVKRVVASQGDKTAPALWALDLHTWVRSQEILGKAPQLGENTHWRVEKGRLEKNTQAGTSVYTVDLIAEFTQRQGENYEN